MNIFIWNVRGAGNQHFIRSTKTYIRQYNANILVLMETKIGGIQADKYLAKIGCSKAIKFDPIGFSGGIWILWKEEDVSIELIPLFNQTINVVISHRWKGQWLFIAFYASPITTIRHKLWTTLKEIHQINKLPWLIAECSLIDLGATVPKFTWSNGKPGNQLTRERLDKAFCSADWRKMFPDAIVQNLAHLRTDYHPILVAVDQHCKVDPPLKTFRFEMAWMQHAHFNNFVNSIVPAHFLKIDI
ncbi:uncharacterized protein LOC132804988 [Ziziphus jujuba]|uniref:Uncharacterized protein LOC132804988 n=1 Tax=Ziziphus jujuba TaxID=326968 RepID=A0ABM4AFP9_ZIZJJ|nr:uncharacterized protein LOC132804988 [Ziziphus jujuba]